MRGRRLVLALLLAQLAGGCAALFAHDATPGPDDVDPEVRLPLRLSVVGLHATMLLLYGSQAHDQFLGCVSCERADAQSIFNAEGVFGSTRDPRSIWNPHGRFGGRTSPESPWNPQGTAPPLMKDEYGHTHGYFTANTAFPGRTTDPALVRFLTIWSERLGT